MKEMALVPNGKTIVLVVIWVMVILLLVVWVFGAPRKMAPIRVGAEVSVMEESPG
jgi:hypothetical protein